MLVEIAVAGSAAAEERDWGGTARMEANSHTPVIFEGRAALIAWCLLAGLALAPMPILHAMPTGFLYYLFESAPPGWTRFTSYEAYWVTIMGLPLAPIFLAWSLPSASSPGVPMRSIVVLCLVIAYNPFRHYFESHFYGGGVARISGIFNWSESPLLWTIWRLDTPLLIGLGATALLRHHTLRPLPTILFHWILFVCALWAAGPLYAGVFYDIMSF
jgi:hypothetical protein